MSSDPEIRSRIIEKIQEVKHVKADTLSELKARLDMHDVSNTQFGRALSSLYYKYHELRINRPHEDHRFGPRIYEVSLGSIYTSTESRTVVSV